jgi:hypothetical protein
VGRPLQEHIAYLEERIEMLKARQDDPDLTAVERYQAARDLEIAETALVYFRNAFEVERKISI